MTQKQYAQRKWQMWLSVRNNMKPTRSLYDIRFTSYGPISEFHVFGDLDIWHIPVLVIFIYISNIIPGYLHVKCCNNHPSFIRIRYRLRTHIYILAYRQTDSHKNTSITITSFCEINNENYEFLPQAFDIKVSCIPILKTPTSLFLEIIQILWNSQLPLRTPS